MGSEAQARQQIDALLTQAGWQVQDYNALRLSASSGVAIREFPLTSGTADYLLFVKRKAVGVIEAKHVGTTLSGVADQSGKYTTGLPANVPHVQEPLPFAYESTGEETFFRDLRDPAPCSRRTFAFHRPETLREWCTHSETLRSRLRTMPPLLTTGLWNCQIEAIESLEQSLAQGRPRALIQMATGSGKTFTVRLPQPHSVKLELATCTCGLARSRSTSGIVQYSLLSSGDPRSRRKVLPRIIPPSAVTGDDEGGRLGWAPVISCTSLAAQANRSAQSRINLESAQHRMGGRSACRHLLRGRAPRARCAVWRRYPLLACIGRLWMGGRRAIRDSYRETSTLPQGF